MRAHPMAAPAATMLLMAITAITLGAAAAEAQSISLQPPQCFKFGDNQVVNATTAAEPPGSSSRLYFQWTDHPAYYWVDFERDGPGKYWGIPPKPETRNTQLEYYGVLLDALGREIAHSPKIRTKVTGDCQVKLTPQQYGAAQNLTIGETSSNQPRNRVLGFLCDGIVTRVDTKNVKRADEICRTCVVAWWARKELLIPVVGAGAAAGITTIVVDKPEATTSRPSGH